VIEIFLGEEILRVADQAERLQDEAVAVRRRRVNALLELADLDGLDALEGEIDDFGMAGCRRLRLLRKKQRRNEEKREEGSGKREEGRALDSRAKLADSVVPLRLSRFPLPASRFPPRALPAARRCLASLRCA